MEEDDSGLMQELLTKIDILSIENNELESELKNLDKIIKGKKEESLKNKFSKIDYKKDKNFSNINIEFDIDALVTKTDNDNLKKTTINFVPFDNFGFVSILGDFTSWEKKPMKKLGGNIFEFQINLLKGFKYFFMYEADGMKVCDFNSQIIENPYKNNELCNYIEIKTEAQSVVDFASEYQTNKANLESNINCDYYYKFNCKEEEILSKIIDFSINYSKRENTIQIKKEDASSQIKKLYNDKIKSISNSANKKFEEITDFFKDRIAKIDNTLYLIKNVDYNTMNFKGIKLYDKNLIKVNLENHEKSRFFESISFKTMFEKGKFFDLEQTEKFLEDYKNSKEILKIYYQSMIMGENNGYGDYEDDNLGYSQPSSNAEKEFVPYKILPEGVDINEYNLIFDKDKIIDIKTRDTGTMVLFEAIEINNKTNRKLSGFVSTSLMKIYTTLYSKDIINVLHVHLNDTSEEISVDSAFLEKNENPEEYKNFVADISGKKLNYKFIFKDYKLNKVYYNVSDNFIDELKFEEIRISINNIVRIREDKTYKDYYAKIVNLPLGLLARKDKEKKDVLEKLKSSDLIKEGFCKERHLDELQGFVDIQIMFTPSKEAIPKEVGKFKISIPICNLILLTFKEQTELEKEIVKNQFKEENNLLNKLDEDYLLIKNLEKYTNFQYLSTELNDSTQAKEILEKISAIETEKFKNLSEDDAHSKIEYINSTKDLLTDNLQKHLRVLSFSFKK